MQVAQIFTEQSKRNFGNLLLPHPSASCFFQRNFWWGFWQGVSKYVKQASLMKSKMKSRFLLQLQLPLVFYFMQLYWHTPSFLTQALCFSKFISILWCHFLRKSWKQLVSELITRLSCDLLWIIYRSNWLCGVHSQCWVSHYYLQWTLLSSG